MFRVSSGRECRINLALWQAVEDHVAKCRICCLLLESMPADTLSSRIRLVARLAAETSDDPLAIPKGLQGPPR
jgi:hypothetical protein